MWSSVRTTTVVLTVLAASALPAQNSTRKIRPQPSALAAKIGTAVRWRDGLDAALAEAKTSGKPVFWYVPTLLGSPMDRQVEIDRYMMAGPFSWPRMISLLNEHYVPVKQVARAAEQKRFEIKRGQFIEPGYFVLDGDGGVLERQDRIATLHPQWLMPGLEERAGVESTGASIGPSDEVGLAFQSGAEAFFARDEDKAFTLWRALAEEHPDHPLAWKAMAEVEGHGALVNGFEHTRPLLDGATARSGDGTRANAGVFSPEQIRAASVNYLHLMQRSDGGWVDSRYDFGGTDSLPNVWVAVSALATQALVTLDPDDQAARRGLAYVLNDEHLNREDADELIWAFLYRAQMLCAWMDARPDDVERMREPLQSAVDDIIAQQLSNGAWRHEYPNPFVICSCLVALKTAKDHGAEVPQERVDRGVLAALKCRADNGAVPYYFVRRGTARANVAAGVGRMPLMENALTSWEQSKKGALQRSIELSFEHHDELAAVRRYDDHASRLGYGGFFFWYDMHVRGEAIESLQDEAQKQAMRGRQLEQILALPEFDGAFIDSHELGRTYGTAMALICWAMCDDIRRAK